MLFQQTASGGRSLTSAYSVDEGGTQQEGAMRDWIGSHRAQRLVVFHSQVRTLLLKALLVRDGLLLDILDIQGPTELVVEIENRRISLFSQDTAKQLPEFYRVVNSEIQPEPTKRIIDVGGIARQENAAFTECGQLSQRRAGAPVLLSSERPRR